MEKRLAVFTFLNKTELRTLVDFYNEKGEGNSFIEMFEQAKQVWTGDEERGRGRVVSFEVGVIVTLKPLHS